MKILVTGSRGQLGRAILSHFDYFIKSKNIKIIRATKDDFNLLYPERCEFFLEKVKPDLVINTAAYTQVDNAEVEQEVARMINSCGPRVISKTLANIGGKLLHFSTDYVFRGNQDSPYKTNQPREPLNFYGKTKAMGEQAVEDILFPLDRGYILRTSWLMGPIGHNFALTMMNLFDNKESDIKVVADQLGSPTSTLYLAKVCWEIVQKVLNNQEVPKIMHWSDEGITSWYYIALAIRDLSFEKSLIKKKPNIIPILSQEFKTLANRPKYSVLETSSTSEALGIKNIFWKKNINDFLDIRKKYLDSNYII